MVVHAGLDLTLQPELWMTHGFSVIHGWIMHSYFFARLDWTVTVTPFTPTVEN